MSVLEREFVFLSYVSDDLKMVLEVYEGLKKRKVNVWMDKKNLGPGRWKHQIEKVISRSKYFVIFLSNAAIKKTSGEKPSFLDEELRIALGFAREQDERGLTIIPVRLEDCDRGDMSLSTFQQYDLFPDFEKGLDQLAVVLGGSSLLDENKILPPEIFNKTVIDEIHYRAEKFFYNDDYEEANTLLDAIKLLNIETSRTFVLKAALNRYLNKTSEQIIALDRALKSNPDDIDLLIEKASALWNIKRYKEACEIYDNILSKEEKAIEISAPLRIFLCHSKGDKLIIRALYRRLKISGLNPWLDEEDLLPGEEWSEGITNAISSSNIVLVCISRESINKTGYVNKEITYALDEAEKRPEDTIYIIPAKLEECPIPKRLSKWQYVDLFDSRGYDRLMESFRKCAKEIKSRYDES